MVENWQQNISFNTCGTAICGGSAIAAITSHSIRWKQTSISLGVIFSIALFVFPAMGIGYI
jgi:uncharacterized membrane protein YadS